MAIKRKKQLDRPQKVKTTLEELEVLTSLKGSTQWAIAKRVAGRYIELALRDAFNIREGDPEFKIKHVAIKGEVVGIKRFIQIIEKSGERLEKMEEKE